jgi:hypothetical protein
MKAVDIVEMGVGVLVAGIALLLLLTTDSARTTASSVMLLMLGAAMILRPVGRRVFIAKVVAVVLGVAAVLLGVITLVGPEGLCSACTGRVARSAL